jgi:hypothetical protein
MGRMTPKDMDEAWKNRANGDDWLVTLILEEVERAERQDHRDKLDRAGKWIDDEKARLAKSDPPSKEEQACPLWDEGFSIPDIARHLRCSPQLLRKHHGTFWRHKRAHPRN